MPDRRFRLLIVASHPVQYATPVFRAMAEHPRLEIQVAYCSMQGSEEGYDPEFGRAVKWDVPLLEGYPWTNLPNRSLRPGLGRFFGLFNPRLWRLIRRGKFDAVAVYTGYVYATYWMGVAACKFYGKPLLVCSDAHELQPRLGSPWKARIKKWLWPLIFGMADVTLVASSGTFNLFRSLGLSEERLMLAPSAVDNDWWKAQAGASDRNTTRRKWNVPVASRVVLFCGKLQPWKRPLDLVQAFAQAALPDSYLVFAGEGPLRTEIEECAKRLGIAERMRLMGFLNQTDLPAAYAAADLFVLPSESETFGLVVNEAMACGCPVVLSDRVGAHYDLVIPGETGFVYPTGDVRALADLLRGALADTTHLEHMSTAARSRIDAWSPEQNAAGVIAALDRLSGKMHLGGQ